MMQRWKKTNFTFVNAPRLNRFALLDASVNKALSAPRTVRVLSLNVTAQKGT